MMGGGGLYISQLQHCLLSTDEPLCAKSCARSVNVYTALWETPGRRAYLVPYIKAIFVRINLPAVSLGQFLHSPQSQVWQMAQKQEGGSGHVAFCSPCRVPQGQRRETIGECVHVHA